MHFVYNCGYACEGAAGPQPEGQKPILFCDILKQEKLEYAGVKKCSFCA